MDWNNKKSYEFPVALLPIFVYDANRENIGKLGFDAAKQVVEAYNLRWRFLISTSFLKAKSEEHGLHDIITPLELNPIFAQNLLDPLEKSITGILSAYNIIADQSLSASELAQEAKRVEHWIL